MMKVLVSDNLEDVGLDILRKESEIRVDVRAGLKPDELILITYREYLEHYFVGQSVLTQKDIVQYSTSALFDYSGLHRAMSDGTVRFVITDGSTGPVSILDSTYSGGIGRTDQQVFIGHGQPDALPRAARQAPRPQNCNGLPVDSGDECFRICSMEYHL